MGVGLRVGGGTGTQQWLSHGSHNRTAGGTGAGGPVSTAPSFYSLREKGEGGQRDADRHLWILHRKGPPFDSRANSKPLK